MSKPLLNRILLAVALSIPSLSACQVLSPPCLPAPGQPAPGVIVGGQARLPVALAEAGATAAYAREVVVSGGEVFLSDAAGRALPGVNVMTSTGGDYQMNRVPPGQALVIAVRAKTASGESVLLRGLLRTSDQGARVEVNTATTIATMALLEGQRGAVGDFDPASYDKLVAKVYQKLATVTNLNLRDEAAVVAQFKTWMTDDAELRTLYDQLRAEVTKPVLTLEEQIRAIQLLQGLPTASGLPVRTAATPTPGPGLPFPSPSASADASPSAVPSASASLLSVDVATVAGATAGFADGTGTQALFNSPGGMAFDPGSAQPMLYMADTGNNRIRRIDLSNPAAPIVTTIAGTGKAGSLDGAGNAAEFNVPFGVAFDTNGTLLVVDSQNERVRRIDVHAPDAAVTTVSAPTGSARFNNPTALAVDPQSGAIYVSDFFDNTVRRLAPDAPGQTPSRFISNDSAAANGVLGPMGLAVDPNHFLWVADSGKGLIRTVAADGTVATFAGRQDNSTGAHYAEGTGSEARFDRPTGLTVHPDGGVVVADAGNHRIRRVDAGGRTSLIAGGVKGSADGRREDATFDGPTWVVVGPDGVLYVADTGNNRIRRVIMS